MGTLYFTRHGQTVWNVENKICGATDIALTELGHAQAIELGKRLAAEKLPIDEILYSPLVRGVSTGNGSCRKNSWNTAMRYIAIGQIRPAKQLLSRWRKLLPNEVPKAIGQEIKSAERGKWNATLYSLH